MKVIIQIPCYNEEKTLSITLDALPKTLPGVDEVEVLIVDDGSSDRTAEVARDWGVHHIVALPSNLGLAGAFRAGIDASVRHGADIIVNTDADNQYCADDIGKLIQPIVDRNAEIVIGARPIKDHPHFSWMKKRMQRIGSWVVRMVSGTDIPDAPSGFRALSRDAAMQVNIFNRYTYTLEMIIQAGAKGIPIASVPIRVNEDLRPSRLVKSSLNYAYRSFYTILRIFIVYKPFRFFMLIAAIPFLVGLLIEMRYVYWYFQGLKHGKIQSLIAGSTLMSLGFLLMMVALIADLISVNRRLLEKLDWRVRQIEERKPKD